MFKIEFKYIAIFLGKFLSIYAISFFPYKNKNRIVWDASDSGNYIGAAWDFKNALDTCRLPLYSLILKVFTIISNTKFDYLIIILQVLLSFVAVYFLFKTLSIICSEKISFIISLLFAINPYVSFYDLRILTESFSISLLIITGVREKFGQKK